MNGTCHIRSPTPRCGWMTATRHVLDGDTSLIRQNSRRLKQESATLAAQAIKIDEYRRPKSRFPSPLETCFQKLDGPPPRQLRRRRVVARRVRVVVEGVVGA